MRLQLICAITLLLGLAETMGLNLGDLFGSQTNQHDMENPILIGSPRPKPLRSAADEARIASINCGKYVCDMTLECVDKPIQCSCPQTFQKCKTKDWYYCLRSDQDCKVWDNNLK